MSAFLKSGPVQVLLAWLLAWYIRAVLRLQFGLRIEGREHIRLLVDGEPMIAAFWHETLPASPLLWREARKAGMTRPAVVLASRHKDGQLIGHIMCNLGMGLVSGSSSKGGVAGMQELVRAINAGSNVAITPDGPRGPARHAAAGVAALAGITGTKIMPCGVTASFSIKLKNSWDGMRIPLPFGRLVLICGEPLEVPREDWRAALPRIEAALNEAQARAAP